MMAKQSIHKTTVAIFLIWLFHISAIIGISLGNLDWFVRKTPINLLLCLALFIWVFPIDALRKWIAFFLFFSGGMLAEWLGVNFGLLFGDYTYGQHLGPKLDGVPLLIGVNWALLTFVSASIIGYLTDRPWAQIVLSAILMVLLDYLMEHCAPGFDFWTFEGGMATLENYISWFAVALTFQWILHRFGIEGNQKFSLHFYLSQFVFFGYFYFYLG
jgi:putative membrane protein